MMEVPMKEPRAAALLQGPVAGENLRSATAMVPGGGDEKDETMGSSASDAEENLKQLRIDAMRGNWKKIVERFKQEREIRTAKITVTGDTLLHMAVFNRKEKVVANMIDFLVKFKESSDVEVTVDEDKVNTVLEAENDKRNMPLHLAAIIGNVKMCKKIGGVDPTLIARRNIAGETPLFLAALYGRKEAFLWLHYLYMRSPGVSSTHVAHCIRDNGDTILHCAIAEEHIGVAMEIIHLYKDLVRGMKRNKQGLSPLHLLAASPSNFKTAGVLDLPILFRPIYWLWKVEEKNQATTLEELHKKNEDKIWVKFIRFIWCVYWWLQYYLIFLMSQFFVGLRSRIFYIPKMKRRHTWAHQIMTELLQHASDEDMSQIILRTASEHFSISKQTEDEDDGCEGNWGIELEPMVTQPDGTITIETPLMIAAKNGVVEMVEKIMELFPSRIKDVNAEGKNILLLAVEHRQTEVLKFLIKQKSLTQSLVRQVDKDGNNALHLAAGLGVEPDWLDPREAQLTVAREINWFGFMMCSMPRGLMERHNRKMETPEDIFIENHRELMKSEAEWAAKTSEACSVVSTLVVSAAFATRTNVPGGYDDKGYAILRKKPTEFKIFKHASLVALFCSLISTICFLSIAASRSQSVNSWKYVPSKFYCGLYFMFTSIVCLWISFCAADFFMLDDDNKKLRNALPTYFVLSLVIFLFVVVQLPTFLGVKLYRVLRTPAPRRKVTPPIEYRKAKNKENGADLNR